LPEQIKDGTGQNNYLVVNTDGSINVSGISMNIGSVLFNLEDVYIASGVTFVDTRKATLNSYNPAIVLNYSGTSLSQVLKFTATGSTVQNFNWSGGLLVLVGSVI
jgi:hypothetical protein